MCHVVSNTGWSKWPWHTRGLDPNSTTEQGCHCSGLRLQEVTGEVGNSGFLPCGKYALVVALNCQVREIQEEVSMHTIGEDEQEINLAFAETL